MDPIDRVVLERGREDFQPMTPLKKQIPSGTLYRHIGRLVALGWLEKQGTSTAPRRPGSGSSPRPSVHAPGQPWSSRTRPWPWCPLQPIAPP